MMAHVAKAIAKKVIPDSIRFGIKGWMRTTVLNVAGPDLRQDLAALFLEGCGIEIGALHLPLPVGKKAHVSYIDRLSVAEARRHYPELRGLPLVEPDIITDGQTLNGVEEKSQDFVIANHFVEHAEDPIGTLNHFVRVLKPGGVLFIALPDRRFTFDKDRPETSYEHVKNDHEFGPERSRQGHYEEWVRLVERVVDADRAKARTLELMASEYSIHFHVWSPDGAFELLKGTLGAAGCQYEVLTRTQNPAHDEMIFVVKVNSRGLPSAWR